MPRGTSPGTAIFYADRMTGSMERCIEETKRRRELQVAFNREHGITPRSVAKSVDQVRFITRVADARTTDRDGRMRRVAEPAATYASEMDTAALIELLEKEMKEAAANLDFEAAARFRDQLFEIRAKRDSTTRVRSGGLERIKARR